MGTTAQATHDEPLFLLDKSDGVATITLNRPKQYNVLSEAMMAGLQAVFDGFQNDLSTRVVVVAAKGKAFCAGHDLKQMRANPDESYYQKLFAQCSRLMHTITSIPQPVIAKIQGIATAAGCQLVATCDLAVAADTARFAVSGINVGLFCSTPSVALSRNVSRKQAFEMLVTGDFIDAGTAQNYGLINRIARLEDLDAEVAQLSSQICGKPMVAVRIGKQMFYQQLERGVSRAYEFAAEVMAGNMMAEDTGEGIDAFIEKRQPVWKNEQ